MYVFASTSGLVVEVGSIREHVNWFIFSCY